MTNPTKVVPVEPTEAMITAGADCFRSLTCPHPNAEIDADQCYQAMLSAAPPASTLPDTNPDADEAADRLANELRGDVRPVVPASILDDLEGLPVVKSEQQFKSRNGTYLVDAVLLSDLNAIIEKHRCEG